MNFENARFFDERRSKLWRIAGFCAPSILSPPQRVAVHPPSTSCSPLLFVQAAATARIDGGRFNFKEAVESGNLALVADFLLVNPKHALADSW